MSVESSNAIVFATLSDWLKNLTAGFQWMTEAKPKSIASRERYFSRASGQWLIHCAVCSILVLVFRQLFEKQNKIIFSEKTMVVITLLNSFDRTKYIHIWKPL